VDVHILTLYTWIHPRVLQTEYRPINQRQPFAIRRPWNGTRTSRPVDTDEIIGSSDFDLRGFFTTRPSPHPLPNRFVQYPLQKLCYCFVCAITIVCHAICLYSQTGREIAWHDKQKFLHNQSSFFEKDTAKMIW
jgi:hypothetical protein